MEYAAEVCFVGFLKTVYEPGPGDGSGLRAGADEGRPMEKDEALCLYALIVGV